MLAFFLRVAGIACGLAGLVHVLFGVHGDWIIGVLPASPVDPTLDSQNRFYGGAFILYGVLLWIGAGDLRRHALMLRALLAMLFFAGCARFLSVMAYGWPSTQVMMLWSCEVLLPPLVWIWLSREYRKRRSGLRS